MLDPWSRSWLDRKWEFKIYEIIFDFIKKSHLGQINIGRCSVVSSYGQFTQWLLPVEDFSNRGVLQLLQW